MKKKSKLKLAGALLGATLISATAGVAAQKDMSKSEEMMAKSKDANMTSMQMDEHKKMMEKQAKAADSKHSTMKWG